MPRGSLRNSQRKFTGYKTDPAARDGETRDGETHVEKISNKDDRVNFMGASVHDFSRRGHAQPGMVAAQELLLT